MLSYHKLTKALLSYGFELNPYDPCVANKMVKGEQLTICWHVDGLKSSHMNLKVNDKFLQWIKEHVQATWRSQDNTRPIAQLSWHDT